MSDEHPVEEPGPAAPAWAAVPTMPWERVPDQRRGDLDNAPTSPPYDDQRYPQHDDPRRPRDYDGAGYDRRDHDGPGPERRDYDGRDYDGRGYPPGGPGRPPAARGQGRTYGTPSGPPAHGQPGYGPPAGGYEEPYWDDTPPPGRRVPPRQPQAPLRAGPPPRPARRREDERARGEDWRRDDNRAREDNWGREEDWGRGRRDDTRRDDGWRDEARRDEPRRDEPRRDDPRHRDDDWARGVERTHGARDDERARDGDRGRDAGWSRDGDRGHEADWGHDADWDLDRTRDSGRGREAGRARDGDRGRDGRDIDRGRDGRDIDRGRDADLGRDGRDIDRGRDADRGRDGRDGERGRGRGGRGSEPWPESGGRRSHPDAPTSGYPIQAAPSSGPPSPGRGRPAGGVYGSAAPRDADSWDTDSHETLPRSYEAGPRSHETPPRSHEALPRSQETLPRDSSPWDAGSWDTDAGPLDGRDLGDEPTVTTGELPRIEAADDPAVARPTSGTPFSVSPAGPSYTPAPLTRAGVDGLQATGYLPIVRPGAAGFPPELAAVAKTVRQPDEAVIGEAVEPAAPEPEPVAAPDPEQLLAGFEWRFDPDTLREQIEGDEVARLEEIRDQLTSKLNGVADNPTRARLLSLRAVVSRILGDLLKAFADGKLALAHAEATGELRRIAIAQARLAGVLQWRGEFEEADRLLTLANSSELPDRLRATMHQHAGRCAYDQGRYMEACNHFERALDLRKEEDPELIAQTELALDAVFRRVAEKGWGPYPRSREEILQIRKPPAPAFDEDTQRWGFTDAEFNFCIGPGYVDVQPFRDGVAWVQRQGSETWELIDDTGRPLIDPSAGYLGVSSFSDGLAWVSRDGTTRWIAIDKANTVLISTGFDDVRPFRRGVAAVRRGHRWGAVDGVGRMVVPFQFDGFATALHDGRYIDGFSDEGLAVVSLSGRKGVVDRSGRVIVPPVHHVLMIHPVAFLVADEAQRWGALDRRGRMIIEQTFPSRMGVTDEIDRLLADTRPVM